MVQLCAMLCIALLLQHWVEQLCLILPHQQDIKKDSQSTLCCSGVQHGVCYTTSGAHSQEGVGILALLQAYCSIHSSGTLLLCFPPHNLKPILRLPRPFLLACLLCSIRVTCNASNAAALHGSLMVLQVMNVWCEEEVKDWFCMRIGGGP